MQPSKRTSKRGPNQGLTDRTKKIVLGALVSVLVIGGGWWAYNEFTTVPPPELPTAKAEDITSYLGSARGFARLPVDDREDFLVRMYERFGEGAAREDFAYALNCMSRRERQVFLDAFLDLTRVRAMEQARQYSQISSRQKRAEFIDQTIRNFESIRRPLGSSGAAGGGPGGSAPPAASLGDPFKDNLPKGSDELMKVVVSRTTAEERSEIKPFADAVAARYKEIKAQKNRDGS